MFDIATRYAPANPHAAMRIPFDWQLGQPELRSIRVADYDNPCALPFPLQQISVLQCYSLTLEDTLQTAVLLSLFTDARANTDDALPYGQTDKRGWCGQEFVGAASSRADAQWGSRLWLYYSGVATQQHLDGAQFAAQEALAWMVNTGLADRVQVEAEWHSAGGVQTNERMALRVQIYQAKQSKPTYDVLWGTSIERGSPALQSSVGDQ